MFKFLQVEVAMIVRKLAFVAGEILLSLVLANCNKFLAKLCVKVVANKQVETTLKGMKIVCF